MPHILDPIGIQAIEVRMYIVYSDVASDFIMLKLTQIKWIIKRYVTLLHYFSYIE